MTLESIERLRNYFKGDGMAHGAIHKLIDDVEREIAERYMKLPVDADGVPIRIGDNMEATDDVDEDGRPYKQLATGYTMSKPDGKGNLWFTDDDGIAYDPRYSCHVKPRTIEGVLKAFFHDALDADAYCTVRMDDVIAKYADELRQMGVKA